MFTSQSALMMEVFLLPLFPSPKALSPHGQVGALNTVSLGAQASAAQRS
jgi:hypothetical protein